MSLVHDILDALPGLRAEAESLMVDACTVTRTTGGRAFDPATGTYTARTSVTVYSGPCQVQIGGTADALTPEAAGGDVTVQQLVVKVPVGDESYRVQDLVSVTASIFDATLIGRTYRVTALHAKTYATTRRLQCEEVTDG